MPELTLVPHRSDAAAKATESHPVGRRYMVHAASGVQMPHGVVGDYHISEQAGEAEQWLLDGQGTAECLVWDTEIEGGAAESLSIFGPEGERLSADSLGINACVLETAEQEWPLYQHNTLSLMPRLEVRFSTDVSSARLGLITLVEAQRFLLLEDGTRHTLLDTNSGLDDDCGHSALYLKARGAGAVDQITPLQARGVTGNYCFSVPLSQPLIEEVGGTPVVSMTVLEQYSSYVMQQLDDPDNGVWLPVHAPITWGWSIRVGRRNDREWDILRRKMIRPTVGHEGLQLPVWTTNTLQLQEGT